MIAQPDHPDTAAETLAGLHRSLEEMSGEHPAIHIFGDTEPTREAWLKLALVDLAVGDTRIVTEKDPDPELVEHRKERGELRRLAAAEYAGAVGNFVTLATSQETPPDTPPEIAANHALTFAKDVLAEEATARRRGYHDLWRDGERSVLAGDGSKDLEANVQQALEDARQPLTMESAVEAVGSVVTTAVLRQINAEIFWMSGTIPELPLPPAGQTQE